MRSEPPLLALHGVGRRFLVGDQEVHALRDVSLRVQPGEMLAVTGPSGSGKSTLMHLAGLLDTATSGRHEFAGVCMESCSEAGKARARNRDIGFVFQHFQLLPHLSAQQNVELPMRYAGSAAAEREERACALLHSVGMLARRHHRPTQLSGGEQQRVAIARALANTPRLLLADEPTGALDSANSEAVVELLTAISREQRIALMVVTHDAGVAQRFGRQLRMRDGLLVSDSAHDVAEA